MSHTVRHTETQRQTRRAEYSDPAGPSGRPVVGAAYLTVGGGTPRRRVALVAGSRLGPFRVERHLGSGAVADVYLAYDCHRESPVALKLVDLGPDAPPSVLERARREQAALGALERHRYLVQMHDLHLVPFGGTQLAALAMEYADGGTLRDWLQDHRGDHSLRIGQGLELFRGICHAAAALHDAGLCHLDLKPENCLFSGGVLKVGDYGPSALLHDLAAHVDEDRAGSFLGTPVYMSPEQFLAGCRASDRRSDVYSLGIVLYEMMHPRCVPPFDGSYEQLRELHLRHSPLPLGAVPEAVSRAASRCLEKDPACRYQTVTALLEDLAGREDRTQPEEVEDEPEEVEDEPLPDEALEEAYQAASRYVEQRNFVEAHKLCRQVVEGPSNHPQAAALLGQLQQRYDQAAELYEVLRRGLDRRSLDELHPLLLEAVELYPNHPLGRTVLIQLKSKGDKLHQAMELGIAAAEERDWAAAESWFDRARKIDPGGAAAQEAYDRARRVREEHRRTRRLIDRALQSRKGDRALDVARQVDQYQDQAARRLRSLHGDQPR